MPLQLTRRTALAGLAAGGIGLGRQSGLVRAQTPTADDVTQEMDVVYGEIDGNTLLLDVYRLPDRETPRPAVILIYGNSYTAGYASRSQMFYPAIALALRNYACFVVDYRLLTGEPGVNLWPAQLDDVQRAVRWVRANAATYGVDPERIGSYGLSSGGMLASMLGLRETRDNSDASLSQFSSRVACVVTVVGDYDMTVPFSDAGDNQITVNLLGGTFAEQPAAYRDASPIAWVDEESAPFLILQVSSISNVLIPRAMAAALEEAGDEIVYVEDPEAIHSSWTDWNLSAPWTLAFLDLHLQPDT
jgi:acetyl esterase/lipase